MLLRELRQEDWKSIHTYASKEEVSRYQSWGPNTEEDTQDYVQHLVHEVRQAEPRKYVWAILRESDEELIGVAELKILDEYHQTGEVAYILHPDEWGQGIGTEVAKRLIQEGFETFDLHRIQATCHPENKGSIRVLEKCGMQMEGRLRGHLKMKEGRRDSFLFSVLNDE
ncbi:Protein N-acetyltransferase, RimJ/RimL family [Halobacillus dabanensis]|uniref:Protein N-acetyltransferase, RimJ/RimL family n=1 Tax=Halobacillus dabanensis TaxID=240302 RepID=A0A1I3PWV1_HALDA|nr:GNAT family N-acetyltransferase [Halobacillus dabanensis]SFJ26324.1 Protein N-acetyltransferase, RimJ/RimL family [Halobacillus dabanensis]